MCTFFVFEPAMFFLFESWQFSVWITPHGFVSMAPKMFFDFCVFLAWIRTPFMLSIIPPYDFLEQWQRIVIVVEILSRFLILAPKTHEQTWAGMRWPSFWAWMALCCTSAALFTSFGFAACARAWLHVFFCCNGVFQRASYSALSQCYPLLLWSMYVALWRVFPTVHSFSWENLSLTE